VHYNAIQIEFVDFDIPKTCGNLIFTSQNAVHAFFKKFQIPPDANCFCVGEKTKALLQENGKKVLEMAQNASDLGEIIVEKYKKSAFVFFCGMNRRKELPNLMKRHKINFEEVLTYKMMPVFKLFERVFDGVLFFSPSAVESFMKKNTFGQSIGFCIGETTASALQKYTTRLVVANTPTIENVIVQVIKEFDT